MNKLSAIDIEGLYCDDITFCPGKCDMRKCPRNKCNIRDNRIPHSFFADNTPPSDCPKTFKKQYICIKGFSLPLHDDDGNRIENERIEVHNGDVFERTDTNIIGGEVHLEADNGDWIEISEDRFKKCFKADRR